MNINFISKSGISNLYDDIYSGYISGLQFDEMKIKIPNLDLNHDIDTLKLNIKSIYIDNMKEFNSYEKEYLTTTIENIELKILKYNTKSVNGIIPLIKNWNLIKMTNTLDFGFPYTLKNYIIIPQDTIYDSNICEILLHEQFHILQRNNPYYFEKIYKNMGFIINTNNINIPHAIYKRMVSNPDTMGLEYIYPISKTKYILPVMLLDDNNNIIYRGLVYDSHKFENIVDLDVLQKKYNYKHNKIDHPNEIFAYKYQKLINTI